MRILGLDHVSVTTGDIARSLAFYRDLLELPVRSVGELSGEEAERITGVPAARLLSADLDLGNGQVLELLEYVGGGEGEALAMESPGSGHIGLTVDDVDALHSKLVDAGWTVRSAPVELTEPGDWNGVRCMTVHDPDGVAVELVERPRHRVPAVSTVVRDRAVDA
jgi:catechol 2,3-dioxygenase-like lactoylglutathione lyase family enzyme